MTSRAALVAALALGVVTAPLAASAQPTTRTSRIGYLSPNLSPSPHLREAFVQGLRDLGYVEGHNVVIEYRNAEGKFERLPSLAAELVALRVDVIVTPGSLAALAAKNATKSIPIVFPTVGNPVSDGLVASLARPGGNVTGLSNLTPDLVGKSAEVLKQAVPGVTRAAVLWHSGAFVGGTETEIRQRAEAAGKALGVQLQFVETRGAEDLNGRLRR
jgi:putative ABC transport system substrate-binding protein